MKTWRKYRTYKRVQSLWQEYQEIARQEMGKENGQLALVSQKLSVFLDSFQIAYRDFKESGRGAGLSLESLFGDCTEMLVALLELVDKHAQPGPVDAPASIATNLASMADSAEAQTIKDRMAGLAAGYAGDNSEVAKRVAAWSRQVQDPEVAYQLAETLDKALSVAELIVREEKYRETFKDLAPHVIAKVLSLLETVKTPEAKTIALRMIASMSRSMENRLEIARLDGYRKVLRVLAEGEDGSALGREALRTLQHFLEVQEGEAAAGGDDAPPRLKSALAQAASTTQKFGLNFTVSPSVVWSTTKIAVAEASKYLSSTSEAASHETEEEGEEDTGLSHRTSEGLSDAGHSGMHEWEKFPPSHKAVAGRIEDIELLYNEIYGSNAGDDELYGIDTNLTPRAFTEAIANEHAAQGEMQYDNLMKEIIGVQGALKTLVMKLGEAAQDVQLDVFATITKLMEKSRRNQREFRDVDGYLFVQQMFSGISDYSSDASKLFVKDVFGMLQTIIVDGSKEKLVGNLDALELVLRLIPSDCNLEVRSRAVTSVLELLIMHPMNVVSVRRVAGFDKLLQGLTNITVPLTLDRASLQASPAVRFGETICECLCYSAVLMSRHNFGVLQDTLRFCIDQTNTMHPVFRLQLLQCIRDMLRDRNSRALQPIPSLLLGEMVKAMEDLRASLRGPPEGATAGGSWRDDHTFLGTMRERLRSRHTHNNGVIVLLEALAHAVCADSAQVAVFAGVDGMEMLAAWFSSDTSPAVASLCLWLIFEFVYFAPESQDLTPLIVRLICSESLSVQKRMLLLAMLRAWLNDLKGDETKLVSMRFKLRDAGICLPLLDIVRSAGPTVAREALLVLGCLVYPVEKIKAWFAHSVGFDALSDAVFNSALQPNLAVMETLLLMCNLGHIPHVIAPTLLMHRSAPVDLHCSAVLNVRKPAPRYVARLELPTAQEWQASATGASGAETSRSDAGASNRSGGASSNHAASSSSSLLPSERTSMTHGASSSNHRRNPSMSSLHSSQGGHQDKTATNHRRQGSRGSFVSTSSASDEMEALLADLALSEHSRSVAGQLGTEADLVAFSGSAEQEQSHRLALYHFAGPDGVRALFKILPMADVAVQKEVLVTVLAITQANLANAETLSRMQGVALLLNLARRVSAPIRPLCFDLMEAVGMYDVSPEDVDMLLSLSVPSASEDAGGGYSDAPESSLRGASGLSQGSGLGAGAARRASWSFVEEGPPVGYDERAALLDLLRRLCKRTNPVALFAVNGRPSWVRLPPLESFPAAKVGYTLCCWIRVVAWEGDECILLRWRQTTGQQIMEVYFQRIGAQDDHARCLSVRTHTGGPHSDPAIPFAFNAFSAYQFAPDSTWHHLGFTQCNRTVSLYVDGSFVQSCGFTTYPCPPTGPVTKDRPLVATLFGTDRGSEVNAPEDRTGVRAQFAALTLTEGVLEAKTLAACHAFGPLNAHQFHRQPEGEKGHHVKAEKDPKAVVTLRPRNCKPGRHAVVAEASVLDLTEEFLDRFVSSGATSQRQGSVSEANRGPDSRHTSMDWSDAGGHGDPRLIYRQETTSPPFIMRTESPPGVTSGGGVGPAAAGNVMGRRLGRGKDEVAAELGGWMQKHETSCIQQSLETIGGVSRSLLLFSPNSTAQVADMKVLQALLERWPSMRAQFHALRGWSMLLYLLSQSDLTMELFDSILLMVAQGDQDPRTREMKEPLAMLLAMDLLALCPPDLQKKVLREVEDRFLTSSAVSRAVWMATPDLSLFLLLNLYRSVPSQLYPVLHSILHQMAPTWSASQTERVILFIACDTNTRPAAKEDLADLVSHIVASRAPSCDNIRAHPQVVDLMLMMLDASPEGVRVSAVRNIAMLLEDPKVAKNFAKCSGFEAARRYLRSHSFSGATCTALLDLALGKNPCHAHAEQPQAASFGSARGVVLPPALPHPAAIQVLLSLLATSSDEDLQCLTLTQLLDVARIPTHASALLAHDVLEWCRGFLEVAGKHLAVGAAPVPKSWGVRRRAAMSRLIGKLVVMGMFGDPKSLKLKDLVDQEKLHRIAVLEVLTHFENDPQIAAPAAKNVLGSLSALLEPFIDMPAQQEPVFYLQVVRVINRIANQNSDAIRSTMKEVNLLERRDQILVRCLRPPISKEGAFAIMQGFSFEWVAEKASFREAFGLGHLLHILHAFPDEPDLQIGVGCVLSTVFAPIEENRRVIDKIIKDPEVFSRLIQLNVPVPRASSPLPGQDGDEDDAAEETAHAMVVFFDWYYQDGQRARREAFEYRIRTQIRALDDTLQKGFEKAAAKRSKRLKQAHERVAKEQAALEKIVGQAGQKRSTRIAVASTEITSHEKTWARAFEARLAEGESAWISLRQAKNVSPPIFQSDRSADGASTPGGVSGGRDGTPHSGGMKPSPSKDRKSGWSVGASASAGSPPWKSRGGEASAGAGLKGVAAQPGAGKGGRGSPSQQSHTSQLSRQGTSTPSPS